MNKNLILYGLALLSFIFLQILIVKSEIPATINLQGYLTDNSGMQKSDGKYYINIRLFENKEEGTAVWVDLNREITVLSGIFSVVIGKGFSEKELPAFNKPFWLEMQIVGELPMSPRLQLHSTPYSLNSNYADSSVHSKSSIFAFLSDSSRFAKQSDSARFSTNSLKAKIADSSGLSAFSRRSNRADTADFLVNIELPIASIIAYGGKSSSIPAGWLICDGRGLESKKYPKLFSSLSTNWGDGSEDTDSTTDFNIPDLRGMFLRGVSDSTDNDPDAYVRHAPKHGGNSGDIVGSVQNHACVTQSQAGSYMDQSSSFNVQGERIQWSEYTSSSYKNTGSNETRPVNAYVYFIIKVK